MSEEVTREEAGARVTIAADSYRTWKEDDLLSEFALCTDEMDGDDEQVAEAARAKREGLGLALISRGWAAYEVLHYPLTRGPAQRWLKLSQDVQDGDLRRWDIYSSPGPQSTLAAQLHGGVARIPEMDSDTEFYRLIDRTLQSAGYMRTGALTSFTSTTDEEALVAPVTRVDLDTPSTES